MRNKIVDALITAGVKALEGCYWIGRQMCKGVEWAIRGLKKRRPGNVKPKPEADNPAAPDVAAATDAEREKDLKYTARAIAKHAEEYETRQGSLLEDWERNPELFEAAAQRVKWRKVISQYEDKTLLRIQGSGTNFNFQNTPELADTIHDIVDEVRTERGGRSTPDRNGMDPETGGQRR